MENEKEITPRRVVDDERRVIDLRNIDDPYVAELIEDIISADWPQEGKAFDHEVE